MSDRVKYGDPFAMGNLSDLMIARENDDLEYLKEWSRKAVKTHEATTHIQMKAFERLIEINVKSSESMEEIRQMLRDFHTSNQTTKEGET